MILSDTNDMPDNSTLSPFCFKRFSQYENCKCGRFTYEQADTQQDNNTLLQEPSLSTFFAEMIPLRMDVGKSKKRESTPSLYHPP